MKKPIFGINSVCFALPTRQHRNTMKGQLTVHGVRVLVPPVKGARTAIGTDKISDRYLSPKKVKAQN